jgi:hypothetical protein
MLAPVPPLIVKVGVPGVPDTQLVPIPVRVVTTLDPVVAVLGEAEIELEVELYTSTSDKEIVS